MEEDVSRRLFFRVTQRTSRRPIYASFPKVFCCEELIVTEKPDETIDLGDAVYSPYLLPESVYAIAFLGDSFVSFLDTIIPRFPPANSVLRCSL